LRCGGVLLSVLASGCLTPRVLGFAAGVDWYDRFTPPPQTRIVPERVVLCGSGAVQLQGAAFPPAGVAWLGQSGAPVPVVAGFRFPTPGDPAQVEGVEYRDVEQGACGPVAGTARISIPTRRWSSGEPCSRSANLGVFRTLELSSSSPTTPLQPELLDVVPAQALEVVVPADERAALRLRDPEPAAYLAVPATVTFDGAAAGAFTAGILGGAAVGVVLTPAVVLIAAPILLLTIHERPELAGRNLDHRDFTRWDFEDSDLAGATLRCASLVRADLHNARLIGTDLENTRLLGADLRGADLSSARNLTQRQLDTACGDATTKLPPGLTAPPECGALTP
jgi:hypothetical protein